MKKEWNDERRCERIEEGKRRNEGSGKVGDRDRERKMFVIKEEESNE